MMGISGYKTKKALKSEGIGKSPGFIETSMFGAEFKGDGVYCVVGPTPYIRTWFASITVKGGVISKVQ